MKRILNFLKQYANFKGRARRREYGLFLLLHALLLISFGVAFFYESDHVDVYGNSKFILGLIMWVFLLPYLPPNLAVSVRRLHDFGKNGWLLLLPFIPLSFYLFFMYLFVAIPIFERPRVIYYLFGGLLVLSLLIFLLLLLWLFAMLLIRKSQPGENQYGKNPKEK